MLTGLAILERELGAIDYARHDLRRRLAGKPPRPDALVLRQELQALEARRASTLRHLDDLHEQYAERVERAVEGIRARASRSPASRKEEPHVARRRLGIPDR